MSVGNITFFGFKTVYFYVFTINQSFGLFAGTIVTADCNGTSHPIVMYKITEKPKILRIRVGKASVKCRRLV